MSNHELLLQKLNQIGNSNVVDIAALQAKVTTLENESSSHVKKNSEISLELTGTGIELNLM